MTSNAELRNGTEKRYQPDRSQVLKTLKSGKAPVLKLDRQSRTVAPPVSRKMLFVSQIDFLRMEAKPFRFHKAERANNHIQ